MKVIVSSTVLLNMGDSAIFDSLRMVVRQVFTGQQHFVVADSDPGVSSRKYPDMQFVHPLYHTVMNNDKYRRLRWLKSVSNRLSSLANMVRFKTGLWFLRRGHIVAESFLSLEERRWLSEVMDADLVIVTGGTFLVENYSMKPRLFEYDVILALGKPLLFYTQSLGPFTHEANRRAIKSIMNRAALVCLRDERSRTHLIDLGVRAEHLTVVSDSAFMLAEPSIWTKHTAHSPLRRVGISVREWRYFNWSSTEEGMKNYMDAIRHLVVHLVNDHDADVLFISTCQGVAEYRYDDSLVATKIVDSLPETVRRRVKVDREEHSPAEFMTLVSELDLMVATRMHAAILSMGAGVPVVPIEYEFKTRELFRGMGLDDYVLSIEDIDPHGLTTTVDRAIAELHSFRARQREAVMKLSEDASRVVGLIRQRLRHSY